jgi:hypothetical protein
MKAKNWQSFKESKVAKEFQTLSLSKQTVIGRLEDISNETSSNVNVIITNCSFFPKALGESTDFLDTSQLLNMCSLHSTAKAPIYLMPL